MKIRSKLIKKFFVFGFLVLFLSSFTLNQLFAAVQFTNDTQLDLTNSPVPLYVKAGSTAEEVTISGSNLNVKITSNQAFTLKSTDDLLIISSVSGTGTLSFDSSYLSNGLVNKWSVSSENGASFKFSVKVAEANADYLVKVNDNSYGYYSSDSNKVVSFDYSLRAGFSVTFTLVRQNRPPLYSSGGAVPQSKEVPQPKEIFAEAEKEKIVKIIITLLLQMLQKQPGEEVVQPPLSQIANCKIKSFTRTLKLGMIGEDVRCLQIILNSDPDTRLTEEGIGSPGRETNYFGPLTKKAVIKFQEKYADEILAPLGFEKGTGIVGTNTRIKLNQILESYR